MFGKPDHMKGSHDDLIMALGMCLFVANTSFKRLQESDNLTRAMLDSWKIKTNEPKSDSNYLLEKITSAPDPNKSYDGEGINDMLQNTKQYGWLFGADPRKNKKI